MMRVTMIEEQKYLYAQSVQLQGQTGYIGCLKGDFGSSRKQFHSEWFDANERLKTEEFLKVLNRVITTLREKGNPFNSLKSMMDFIQIHPDSVLEKHESRVYGFRIDIEKYSFLLRLNHPVIEYSSYCQCYVREFLDSHIAEARKGIRFITSNYEELFRIADGDRILVTAATGVKSEYICRYIDEYHVEVGKNLYHICEFAELLEKTGASYKPRERELESGKGDAI